MIVEPIGTKIITDEDDISDIVESYIKSFKEDSILAISAKIVSLTEGSYVSSSVDKDTEIIRCSQKYLPRSLSKYNTIHTITKGTLMLAAGLDESNANGRLVLWPKNPLDTAIKIRSLLMSKFNISNVGVVIVDSTSKPTRIGTVGTSLASCGFQELIDYRGVSDLFGKTMQISQQNSAECIASTAVLAMGEGSQQTPMCVVYKPYNIVFKSDARTTCYDKQPDDYLNDVYETFWRSVDWLDGGDYSNK